jgi:hypothetical protein
MMLAYNSTWIESLEISRAAKRWLESRIISKDQYQNIKTAHSSPLYTPNIFVRIGLAIFTAICISGFVGLFGLLFTSGGGVTGISLWFVVMGVGCAAVLEFLIQNRKLYCAGIDDALLYSSIGLLLTGILFLLYSDNSSLSPLIPAFIALPILLAATIRYADRLTALAAYGCFLWFFVYPMIDGAPLAQALLPFVLMIISLVVYVAAAKAGQQSEYENWSKPLEIIEVAGLVTLYLAGNYLIVRESTVNLLNMEIAEGGNIPYAVVFYLLTIGIPVAYVVLGLKKRDGNLIRVGLLAAAFSAFTFRYYFSLGHPEIVLTVAGILLITIAIAAIRYLKTAPKGFTSERLLTRKLENLDAEMLVVSQTLGSSPQQAEQGFKPGGGTFGGGGTTES